LPFGLLNTSRNSGKGELGETGNKAEYPLSLFAATHRRNA